MTRGNYPEPAGRQQHVRVGTLTLYSDLPIMEHSTLNYTLYSMHASFISLSMNSGMHYCKKLPQQGSHCTKIDPMNIWLNAKYIFTKVCFCIYMGIQLYIQAYTTICRQSKIHATIQEWIHAHMHKNKNNFYRSMWFYSLIYFISIKKAQKRQGA